MLDSMQKFGVKEILWQIRMNLPEEYTYG